jgi:hypothetical protein
MLLEYITCVLHRGECCGALHCLLYLTLRILTAFVHENENSSSASQDSPLPPVELGRFIIVFTRATIV